MALGVEFGFEVGQFRSAHAGAGRIAALRHEAIDHAVEDHAVVEALARKLRNTLDMAGGEIGAEADDDIAGVEGQGEGLGGHGMSLNGGKLPRP